LNIQTEQEVEKTANVELRLIVNTQREQMDDLVQQVKEIEAARIRDQEEMKK
jgi:ACT domain-containing protein